MIIRVRTRQMGQSPGIGLVRKQIHCFLVSLFLKTESEVTLMGSLRHTENNAAQQFCLFLCRFC